MFLIIYQCHTTYKFFVIDIVIIIILNLKYYSHYYVHVVMFFLKQILRFKKIYYFVIGDML